MIKLTPVEKEVLISLYLLTRENPNLSQFDAEEVYERRLKYYKKEPSSNLRRTTREFLNRLRLHVPALLRKMDDGWVITIGGSAVCMTQLKV